MKQTELAKTFMMISNWKKTLVFVFYTKIIQRCKDNKDHIIISSFACYLFSVIHNYTLCRIIYKYTTFYSIAGMTAVEWWIIVYTGPAVYPVLTYCFSTRSCAGGLTLPAFYKHACWIFHGVGAFAGGGACILREDALLEYTHSAGSVSLPFGEKWRIRHIVHIY